MAFIYYVTQVQFEFGAVRLLKQECDRVGITRPLIVSDPGVKAAGVLQKALDALAGLPVAILIRHHPTRQKQPCAPLLRCTTPTSATA